MAHLSPLPIHPQAHNHPLVNPHAPHLEALHAAEARAAGFLNRVVADDALDAEVEALAAVLMGKPKLALLETKAHVNAVTESMVGTGRSWADADGLYAGLRDEEGQASARAYLERLRKS